jgi:hypothetical protein
MSTHNTEVLTGCVDRICAAVERRRACLNDVAPLPDTDIVRTAISGIFNTRTGNELRSAPPRDKRPLANVLWRLMAFHRSSGGIGGVFSLRWACDDIVKAHRKGPYRHKSLDLNISGEQLFDAINTLAIVLLGGQSRAADNWERALGI